MHVTQILTIVLWGASEFQGPTQVTRVNRLASWWYSSGRGGRSTRVKPIQLEVAGFGILRIPTLVRMISNAYVQLQLDWKCWQSCSVRSYKYAHIQCFVQAYLRQPDPKHPSILVRPNSPRSA
jgi:hypothetical protein